MRQGDFYGRERDVVAVAAWNEMRESRECEGTRSKGDDYKKKTGCIHGMIHASLAWGIMIARPGTGLWPVSRQPTTSSMKVPL